MSNFSINPVTGIWENKPKVTAIPTTLAPATPIPVYDSPTLKRVTNRTENFKGSEQELWEVVNSRNPMHSKGRVPADRMWAIVPNEKGERTISLHTIITNIIEGYNYEVEGLPEVWKEILYTPENPLDQDSSDWMLFVTICEEKGYRIRRDDGGRKFTFLPEADGIEKLSSYRIMNHSFGGSVYPMNFLRAKDSDIPIFIIKNGFSVDVSANGSFLPRIRQYIDDEGKSKVVIESPENLSDFLKIDYEFMSEKFNEYAEGKHASGKAITEDEQALFDAVTGKNPSRAQILQFYSKVDPDYDSNNTDDTGYMIHHYEGWNASFTTMGNKRVTPGDWIIIEGTSSNLYFPFQVKGVTHKFSHKWETDYNLIR